jgi:hypothetical protein
MHTIERRTTRKPWKRIILVGIIVEIWCTETIYFVTVTIKSYMTVFFVLPFFRLAKLLSAFYLLQIRSLFLEAIVNSVSQPFGIYAVEFLERVRISRILWLLSSAFELPGYLKFSFESAIWLGIILDSSACVSMGLKPSRGPWDCVSKSCAVHPTSM